MSTLDIRRSWSKGLARATTAIEGHGLGVRGLPERDVEGISAHGVAVFDDGFVADQAEPEHLRITITGQVHGADEADRPR